jgi:hypothetical protein
VTLLVLDGSLLGEALARAGDEDVVVIDPSVARLEELERESPDPRAWFLIGDPAILPLPDASADEVLGASASPELRRVLRN